MEFVLRGSHPSIWWNVDLSLGLICHGIRWLQLRQWQLLCLLTTEISTYDFALYVVVTGVMRNVAIVVRCARCYNRSACDSIAQSVVGRGGKMSRVSGLRALLLATVFFCTTEIGSEGTMHESIYKTILLYYLFYSLHKNCIALIEIVVLLWQHWLWAPSLVIFLRFLTLVGDAFYSFRPCCACLNLGPAGVFERHFHSVITSLPSLFFYLFYLLLLRFTYVLLRDSPVRNSVSVIHYVSFPVVDIHPLFVAMNNYVYSIPVDDSVTPPRHGSKSSVIRNDREWVFDM